MFGLLRLTFLFLLLAPVPASAQQDSDPFCAQAPLEMLAALEGEWTLRQGPGFAAAGAMVIPLPAHPPKRMALDYTEGDYFATLSAEDGSMVMFPTDPDQIEAVVKHMNEADAANLLEIGTGCDWYALPIMAGSNSYSLDRAEGPPEAIALAFITGNGPRVGVCVAMPYEAAGLQGGDMNSVSLGDGRNSELEVWSMEDESTKGCFPDQEPFRLEAGQGQMVMNLLVKFQSPTSATGIVIFEGQMNGQGFGAKAPVRLTR